MTLRASSRRIAWESVSVIPARASVDVNRAANSDDTAAICAARRRGAPPKSVPARTIPAQVMPMLISVFLLVFAATLKDISTTVLIAAPGVRTMSLLMFDFTLSGQLESASVIGVVIAVLCLIVTAISFRLGGRIGIRS